MAVMQAVACWLVSHSFECREFKLSWLLVMQAVACWHRLIQLLLHLSPMVRLAKLFGSSVQKCSVQCVTYSRQHPWTSVVLHWDFWHSQAHECDQNYHSTDVSNFSWDNATTLIIMSTGSYLTVWGVEPIQHGSGLNNRVLISFSLQPYCILPC
jgi:hypothetical protein